MAVLMEFMQTDAGLAFFASSLIFFITIILAAKQKIGFSLTVLLLIFCVVAGLAISNHKLIHYQIEDYKTNSRTSSPFKEHMTHAVQEVENEMIAEKANLKHMLNQMEEIFDMLELQQQKIENFISETQEKFKTQAENKEQKG